MYRQAPRLFCMFHFKPIHLFYRNISARRASDYIHAASVLYTHTVCCVLGLIVLC